MTASARRCRPFEVTPEPWKSILEGHYSIQDFCGKCLGGVPDRSLRPWLLQIREGKPLRAAARKLLNDALVANKKKAVL